VAHCTGLVVCGNLPAVNQHQFVKVGDELTDVVLARFLDGHRGSHLQPRPLRFRPGQQAVLMSSVPPFLLKTGDSPEGVDRSVFDGIKAAVAADRFAYFRDFLDSSCSVGVLGCTRISEEASRASFNVAVGGSACR
jgi:hypothetical protein